MHYRMFYSIPRLHQLDASSSPSLVMKTKNVSRLCQVAPGGEERPDLRTTGLGSVVEAK